MSARCPACRSEVASVFVADPLDLEYFNARSAPAAVMRCDDCGSLFQHPWPSAAEVQQFYGPDYQNYTATAVPLLSGVDRLYQRRQGAAFLKRYGRDVAVLDFGCGQAGFLRSLAELGCTGLAGFDFVLYDELRNTPSTRFYDDLDAILASDQRFDVIRMRHVIEHLTDLDTTMDKLRRLLRPRGRILGETPNAAHYTSRLMGRYWGCLHFPYHTLIFSVRGLERSANRWGLRLSETSGALLPTGWAMSFENVLKAWTRSRTRGRTAIYTLLMAGSMPFAVADRVVQPAATANFDFVLTPAA
jgi:SAM-dependent methyltransferase